MIMIVISFVLVKFYAFAILYVLIVMQIKLVVVVVKVVFLQKYFVIVFVNGFAHCRFRYRQLFCDRPD